MKTVLTTSPDEAAAFIRCGQLAAFPTETVYGLGADAFHPAALARIFAAKERPADNPLIVHVANARQIEAVSTTRTAYAQELIDRCFPGPLTLVLPRRPEVPPEVSAGLDTVAVRMPAHDTAIAFLEACDTPVAAPSANRSGRPSPTSWKAVHEDLQGRIACILMGDRADIGIESTVVDCTGEAPVILREGGFSLDTLRSIVPTIQLASRSENEPARSPGIRHRHYAPRARVVPVEAVPPEPGPGCAYIGLTPPVHPDAFEPRLICRDNREYAHELFNFFRACDAADVRTIYCEMPLCEGLGSAIRDRIRRASIAFQTESKELGGSTAF